MTTATTVQTRALTQQGYDYTPAELKELSWGLRFTPGVCMLIALYGLSVQNPWIHFGLACMGILPFWFPAWHPFDRVYNHLLRPLWNGVRLPPNPLPRRIACVMGGGMNIGVGLSFYYGNTVLAYIFGAILVPLQLIVISTHFCVASWMFEGILRLFGSWTAPIPVAQAKELVAGGARLIDVREPDEFADGHLPDAVNVPLDSITSRLDELRTSPVVLYCQSGLRSQRAMHLLEKEQLAQVYNLGAMTRWGD